MGAASIVDVIALRPEIAMIQWIKDDEISQFGAKPASASAKFEARASAAKETHLERISGASRAVKCKHLYPVTGSSPSATL
jgi:hypothetical protein